MSLLLNDDFSIYRLRQAYLHQIHDGIGERLIDLGSSTAVLNNPAFRAAGWLADNKAIKRCYSPPIPTTGTGEYFRAPNKITGVSVEDDEDEFDRGGMVTGHQGSEDTVGPGTLGASERKRRRRKERVEEDDSSDLSDESDEDEQTATQAVKFAKMPARESPAPNSELNIDRGKPELMITSPSRPPPEGALPRGSLERGEVVQKRARGDTMTSSDMSSENEYNPSHFVRKLSGRPGVKKVLLAEKIQEEEQHEMKDIDGEGGDSDLDDEDVGEASDLSDEFEVEVADESSHLLGLAVGGESEDTSPMKPLVHMPAAVTPRNTTPRRPSKDNLVKLPKLPAGRSIRPSATLSLLTMMLKGENRGKGEKPFQRFAEFSGKGEASPLWIKIYAPFSEKPNHPIEVPLRRAKDGSPVTVAELIGLALWQYDEEGYQPAISNADSDINRWTLRIVEDEEVDFDFPALTRTRPVTDFTSNNNRPPQRRARSQPWDEFGLVRATEEQFVKNEKLTSPADPGTNSGLSNNSSNIEAQQSNAPSQAKAGDASIARVIPTSFNPARNPITGPSLAPSAIRKESGNLLDRPQRDAMQSTPRTGAQKTIKLQLTDPQSFAITTLDVPTTSDTYIAEIFDHGCKKLHLDKALYVLKIHGTQTVAPNDRTVEALGDLLHLDLMRRRFIGAGPGDIMFGFGLSTSQGSSSPNAPVELTTITTPTTGKKKKGFMLHSQSRFAGEQMGGMTTTASLLNLGLPGTLLFDAGKKYNVLRKQPLSFATSHPRTLIITPEYMQILPAAPDSLAAPTGKVTNVSMRSIIGAKVSGKNTKMVRVLVMREKEQKRYDFECNSAHEANEICADIRKGIAKFKDDV